MTKSTKIHVFNEFQPYIRLLTAYNRENLHFHNWHSSISSVFNVFCTTMVLLLMPLLEIMLIWLLIDNGADLKVIVAALPIVFGVLQLELTFIALIINNRIITQTIRQIQMVIDQSKFCSTVFM